VGGDAQPQGTGAYQARPAAEDGSVIALACQPDQRDDPTANSRPSSPACARTCIYGW
jgi:hypothetical protein